ncbi:uncharacterized protein LOC106780611 [Vigna radiata var. radiata]|uniref:Uncharacterized protein LOC106780611 n=1 Tax=Vigna radiata var. radiata TaxID=3916 RepID=A0A1S3W1M8_VIGRR|nr:uncharacterized protein LOC106780611 [Vigna radiata var. radiata]
MVRTRGASSYHGEISSCGKSSSLSHPERRRPTTSARRKRVQESQVDVIEEHEEHEQHDEGIQHEYDQGIQHEYDEGIQHEYDKGIQHNYVEDDYVEQEDVCEEQDEEGGFQGGPQDTSLLTHYTDHVAFAIWQGRDRQEMKVISHGKKLKHFGMYHETIEPFITMSDLSSLVNLSYEYTDHGLIVTLMERWHLETNSFHLPVGEMSVTLDDVHNLLHLPIIGQFCEVEDLKYEEARSHIMDLLGVDRTKATTEMTRTHGPKVKLS